MKKFIAILLIIVTITALLVTTVSAAMTYQTGMYEITSSNGVNLRKGPGTGYSKVYAIGSGHQVKVTEISGTWGKCTFGSYTGWFCLDYSKYIKSTTSNNSQSNSGYPQNGITTTSIGYNLVCRESPSSSSKAVRTSKDHPANLPRGSSLSVLSITKDKKYYYVSAIFEGETVTGYVSAGYVKLLGNTLPVITPSTPSTPSVSEPKSKFTTIKTYTIYGKYYYMVQNSDGAIEYHDANRIKVTDTSIIQKLQLMVVLTTAPGFTNILTDTVSTAQSATTNYYSAIETYLISNNILSRFTSVGVYTIKGLVKKDPSVIIDIVGEVFDPDNAATIVTLILVSKYCETLTNAKSTMAAYVNYNLAEYSNAKALIENYATVLASLSAAQFLCDDVLRFVIKNGAIVSTLHTITSALVGSVLPDFIDLLPDMYTWSEIADKAGAKNIYDTRYNEILYDYHVN